MQGMRVTQMLVHHCAILANCDADDARHSIWLRVRGANQRMRRLAMSWSSAISF